MAFSEGWLWLGGSLLLAVLWANLVWLFREPRGGTIGEAASRLAAWRFSPWLLQSLRLLYYVGTPFAALLWGHDAVVGRLLGLQPLRLPIPGQESASAYTAANWADWARDAGWAMAVGIGTWGLLAMAWWTYRRAVATIGETDPGIAVPGSGWLYLREASYHELHWAFYRNAPAVVLGKYWGAWIGLGLVGIEAALNPAWRKGLSDPRQAPCQLMRSSLAIASSVVFLLTENLWLALALHWGVSWGAAWLVRSHFRSRTRPE